jgi:hypothetical protein
MGWKDEGMCGEDILTGLASFGLTGLAGATHIVENTETGERRAVRVEPSQSVGEAIANGQWAKGHGGGFLHALGETLFGPDEDDDGEEEDEED